LVLAAKECIPPVSRASQSVFGGVIGFMAGATGDNAPTVAGAIGGGAATIGGINPRADEMLVQLSRSGPERPKYRRGSVAYVNREQIFPALAAFESVLIVSSEFCSQPCFPG